MTKRRRVWWLAALSCTCAASLIAAVACGGGKKDPKTYAVAYAAGASDAVGSVATERYVEGTPIILRDSDTFDREGYTFTQWSDGKTLYDAGDKYFVQAHDVTFTAQWEEVAPQPVPEGAETVKGIPTGTLVTANSSARAKW
ncbi:MAG: InlB B-repeat-containing protein [Clostridiales bacterium]|nr:InlB B-repeat-containing protein [Clostridiales bacterium]